MKIYNKLNNSLILNRSSSYAVEQTKSNSFKLMLNAGKKIARQICSNYKKRKTLIICGVGGNGGDGFITAKELLNKNWEIDLVIIGNKSNIKGDSLKALNKLKVNPLKFEDINLNEIELFVDALFGLGLSRNINKETSKVLSTIDKHNAPIVAIDIPSGVDSNTGEILGYAAYCELVITFTSLKYGHILLPGYKKYKKIKVENIGITKSALKKISPKINLSNVSIIGDGLETDILGGNNVQINTILITSGILSHTLNTQYGQRPDIKKLNKAISASGNFPPSAVNIFKISP